MNRRRRRIRRRLIYAFAKRRYLHFHYACVYVCVHVFLCMCKYVHVYIYIYIYIYIFIPMCVCISIYPSIHCSTGSVSVDVQCPFTSSLYEFPVGLNRYWVRLLGLAEYQVLGNTRYSVVKSLPKPSIKKM